MRPHHLIFRHQAHVHFSLRVNDTGNPDILAVGLYNRLLGAIFPIPKKIVYFNFRVVGRIWRVACDNYFYGR